MSYPRFLAQWYNWPYVVSLALAAAATLKHAWFAGAGSFLAGRLGLERVPGHSVVTAFCLALGVVGLTINGALHDYWPSAQEAAFLPGFAVALALAVLIARGVGRIREQYFPEIKAVRFGTPGLSGRAGRVVSRMVSPEYRAGRAQVMDDDGTLHVVLCKTREAEIPYAAIVTLEEYDPADGRYYVELADDSAIVGGGPSGGDHPHGGDG